MIIKVISIAILGCSVGAISAFGIAIWIDWKNKPVAIAYWIGAGLELAALIISVVKV